MLLGVWQQVEVVNRGTGGSRIHPPNPVNGPSGPGMMIFTPGYYSYLSVNTPHERVRPPSTATVDDLIAVWAPFGAHAGPYEIRGDTIIEHTIVAKNPPIPRVGRMLFRVEGDSLWMTNPNLGEVVRFVRLEA
jgi:hypothetical protein